MARHHVREPMRGPPHEPEALGTKVPATVVLVTGVAGSGKSTVALLLADRLGWAHRDADDFHTPANRARMAAGEALTDEDRRPWLAALEAWIDRRIAAREPAVVACSALKRAYRDQLAGGRPEVRLVHLHGSRQLIRSRLLSRHGHFFPAELLDSQFADLQEPEPDEHACVVGVDQPPEAVVAAVVAQLYAVPTEEPHMPPTASGEQWRLRHGAQAAVVVELGGALRHYEVGGRPLLDGFAADERITGGRGQLLVPWPNRVDGGRYRFGAEDLQLPLTEPENNNAIHGLLRWVAWQLLARSEDAVTVGTVLFPQPGYPYQLEVAAEYRLGREGLETTVTTTNVGDAAAPYGVGQHPYLTVGTELVDTALLTVPPATGSVPTNTACRPVRSRSTARRTTSASPGPSASNDWTPPTRGSTGTPPATAWFGWCTLRGSAASTYGSSRASGTCRSTPGTRCRSPGGVGAASPSSRCPVRPTPSAVARRSPSWNRAAATSSGGAWPRGGPGDPGHRAVNAEAHDR